MTFFDVGMREDTRGAHLFQKPGTEIFFTKFPKASYVITSFDV